jgi:hypothetical protein
LTHDPSPEFNRDVRHGQEFTMRVSDQEYFRSCVAKERHLAQLLGYRNIEECYESAGVLWEKTQALPKWTREWEACGPLIAQYGIGIAFGQDPGGAQPSHATLGATLVHFADHPSRDRALMFGIVREVIRLLEHPRAH